MIFLYNVFKDSRVREVLEDLEKVKRKALEDLEKARGKAADELEKAKEKATEELEKARGKAAEELRLAQLKTVKLSKIRYCSCHFPHGTFDCLLSILMY